MNETKSLAVPRRKISKMRRLYIVRLILRCTITTICIFAAIFYPDAFFALEGWNFFVRLTPLHFLWLVWMIDMTLKILPIKSYVPLGAQKIFFFRYRKPRNEPEPAALAKFTAENNKSALKVMIAWVLFNSVPAVLHSMSIINDTMLLLLTCGYYIGDFVCVLIWCPFRIMMRNRCCTTCRIYNWDHLMMFTPMLMIKSFFALSLFTFSMVIWLMWEFAAVVRPERFWEGSNEALRCGNCTDKLCTQFCKHRNKNNCMSLHD